MRALFLIFTILCVAVDVQARPNSLFSGAVTFEFPSTWKVQRHGPHGTAEVLQLLIPDPATENTPESSNAVITAEPLQSGLTVMSLGDSNLRKPNITVLTDIPAGKSWRTVLSHGQSGKTGFVIVDRFGVDAGLMVQMRVAFPVVERADARWMTKIVADCNQLIRSVKIKGKNAVTSELKFDHGVVWLRDLKDPAKTFNGNQ